MRPAASLFLSDRTEREFERIRASAINGVKRDEPREVQFREIELEFVRMEILSR